MLQVCLILTSMTTQEASTLLLSMQQMLLCMRSTAAWSSSKSTSGSEMCKSCIASSHRIQPRALGALSGLPNCKYRATLSLISLRVNDWQHRKPPTLQSSTAGPHSQLQLQTAEALVAALLFAAHPVHTEAVAGIVGHAELLSCAVSITALLVYVAAATATSTQQHWTLLAAAILTLWASALAKEIGITMVSCSCSSRMQLIRCPLIDFH